MADTTQDLEVPEAGHFGPTAHVWANDDCTDRRKAITIKEKSLVCFIEV
jgi:hypothetical protein